MGRYFAMNEEFQKNYKIIGYFDIDKNALEEAVRLTETKKYTLEQIVMDSDILFITVVDGAIETVWNQIKDFYLESKIICHCSGALSSDVFSNIDKCRAYRYSVHPLFACSSKEDSYKDISNALFTIEGSKEKLTFMKSMMESLGNKVQVIKAKDKVKYHASAVMASNQMIGLIKAACDLLKESGFSEDNALSAIKPLIYGNIDNVYRQGLKEALTGPVARGDMGTVNKHLKELRGDTKSIYNLLTNKLVELKNE